MRCTVALLLLLGATGGAGAQEIQGVYVGLSAGYFDYSEDGESLGAPVSDTTSSYRVVAGYQFNSIYAVEVTRGATGTFKERLFGFDPNVGELSLEVSGEYEITTLRFVALAPFSSIGMFGGFGYYDATLDSAFRFESPAEVVTGMQQVDDNGLTVAGGIQYEFERIAVRGEYEWFDIDDVDAQSLSVTALFRF